MLGLCSAPKEDLDASTAELVLGSPSVFRGNFCQRVLPPLPFLLCVCFCLNPLSVLLFTAVFHYHLFQQSLQHHILSLCVTRHTVHLSTPSPGLQEFCVGHGNRRERVTLDRLKLVHLVVGEFPLLPLPRLLLCLLVLCVQICRVLVIVFVVCVSCLSTACSYR